MTRILGIIAAISALMILLAGSGAYWFSASSAKEAKTDAATAVANSLATSLSQQLDTLQNSVDGVAKSPDVIAALSSGDRVLIDATAAKLQSVVPFNLKLRLLLPSVNDTDQSQMPHMGFGDLEMVRTTLTSKPKPVIQGDAEQRHLAITSAVMNGSQVVGVVLASLKADLPQQMLAKTTFQNGLIELKQDQLVLGSVGELADKTDDSDSIDVKNSRWKIETWTNFALSWSDLSILVGLVAIPTLLACLAFFVGYRKLSEFFHQDQLSILKAAKDMFQGKNIGSYSMQLDEMQPIITAMVQFKRVMDQGGKPVQDATESQEHDFFDESFDIDFLEETAPVALDQFQSVPISTSSMAVSMPTMKQEERSPEPVSLSTSNNDLMGESDMLEGYAVSVEPFEKVEPTAAMESWEMSFDSHSFAEPEILNSVADFQEIAPVASPFRLYDISGVIGQNMTQALFMDIGKAFASEASLAGVKTIVVGRDARSSSPACADALITGITSTGCDVLDIGLVPAPVLYFVTHHSEGRSGIMVSGGRQPAEYNGLKLLLNNALLSTEQIQTLKARVDTQDFVQGLTGSVEQNTLFSNEYIGIATEETHLVRPMTVVADCGNGATSQFAPLLLKTMGCDVIELNCDLHGQFTHQWPDPANPANLEALIKAVKLNSADVGVAFDGDGECMGLVDSKGRVIWADRQMMLFARDVLANKPTSEVIYDTASSTNLPEQIKKRGGHAVLGKSGSWSLQSRLRETGATLAGDIHGHFLFNDRWFGFSDGLYAAMRMIEILSADMRASSEMFDDLPDSLITPPWEVVLPTDDPMRFIEKIYSLADFPEGEVINVDGLRVEFSDGWGLVRAVNDASALSLRFEAVSQDVMRRIQVQFKSLMLQVKPDISLPF